MTSESAKAYRKFLLRVSDDGACFGVEVQCADRELCIGLSISGLYYDEGLLLFAVKARPESDFSKLYDEISALNNDLVNTKRELARKNIQLAELASTDALTHMPNRRVVLEHA